MQTEHFLVLQRPTKSLQLVKHSLTFIMMYCQGCLCPAQLALDGLVGGFLAD